MTPKEITIELAGQTFLPQLSGALYWPDENALLAADLHLEKSAAFATKGQFLPPYDSFATLERFSQDIERLKPKRVILLGDSFHRDEGVSSLGQKERELLAHLGEGRDWVWIAGNHDPKTHFLAGTCRDKLMIQGIELTHEPTPNTCPQIAGHLHPAAKIISNGSTVRRSCFVSDGERLIMPSFGVLTGGLSIFHTAFHGLLDHQNLRVVMRGKAKLYPVSNSYLVRK